MHADTLPPPINLASPHLTGISASRRSRVRLGKLSGPGVITWVAVMQFGNTDIPVIYGLYYSPALLADITNSALTTELEGIPLFPNAPLYLGTKGLLQTSYGYPTIIPVQLQLPPGSYHLYFVLANAGTATKEGCLALGYQPLPG